MPMVIFRVLQGLLKNSFFLSAGCFDIESMLLHSSVDIGELNVI